MFTKKSILLLFSFILVGTFSERIDNSKAACQRKVKTACISSGCTCEMSHHQKRDEDLEENITWSKLTMKCTDVAALRKFIRADKCMVYDEDSGSDEAGDLEDMYDFPVEVDEIVESKKNARKGIDTDDSGLRRQTFSVFNLKIEDDTIKEMRTSCTDTATLKCLDNENSDDLEYVTRLEVAGRTLRFFGRSEDPVMQLFPKIRVLTLSPSQKRFVTALVELSYLKEFHVNAQKTTVQLYCAYRSDKCLSNPAGLQRLNLHFGYNSKRQSGFELYGKLRLPKSIDYMRVDSNSRSSNKRSNTSILSPQNTDRKRSEIPDIEYEIDGDDEDYQAISINNNKAVRKDEIEDALTPETKASKIFSHIEFTDIMLRYQAYLAGGLTLDEFELPLINRRFEVEIYESDVNTVLPKLYAMEIEDHLTIKLSQFSSPFPAPYLDLKKASFNEPKFSACHYGNSLLKSKQVDVKQFAMEPMVVVRGLQMKLSKIIQLAKDSEEFPEAFIVRAFVYNLDIDIEPSTGNLLGAGDTKRFEIFYVNVGTTSATIETGIKLATVKHPIFNMKSFELSLLHIRNCKQPDPVFMRALSTCLIVNIADFDKSSPSKLLAKNAPLSRWYKLIQQTRAFKRETYSEIEIAQTESAYKFLEEYLLLRENQISEVARVPLLSLQVLSQNVHILGEAGRDILEKKRHLKTLDTVIEVGEKTGDALKKSFKAIGDSKISILEASKAKSESLGDIELKRQTNLLKEIDNSQELIDHLTIKFDEFASEVKKETANFESGVKLAMGLAIAEAAAEAVNSILSIFSGGFNPVKAMRAARKAADFGKKLAKLMTVMKKIGSLIKKRKVLSTLFKKIKATYKNMKTAISGFFKRQKTVLKDWLNRKSTVLNALETKDLKKLEQFSVKIKTGVSVLDSTKDMVGNTVTFLKAERTVRIGYDPGVPTQSVTVKDDKKLATVEETVLEFKDRAAKDVADHGNELSAVDVFKWTIAREHVTGMIDTTLSDDVPEATNYRAALLKLIMTGETRTQASLDRAALETKFAASKYAWDLYFQEAVSAGEEIAITEEQMDDVDSTDATDKQLQTLAKKKRMDAEVQVEWDVLAIKLDLIRLNEEYCNAYYYFHLEKCQADLRINPTNTLDEVSDNNSCYLLLCWLFDFRSAGQNL